VSHTYEWPRPALTVDCVVFGAADERLEVLLVQRGEGPFTAAFALPGGFVREDEDLDAAARRELSEETGVDLSYMEQLYTFGALGRDPRGRVVTVAWLALVRPGVHRLEPGTDAQGAAWHPVADLPPLAFDHARILDVAKERLRGKLRYKPIGFELLPEAFTLTELQRLYEVVLERPLDKRNFRRKVLATKLLIDTGERRTGVAHRAPSLYRFDRERHAELERDGYLFEV
jgi:8-oxo-dGTP diphosphatase